jgi:hypothetical protein
VVLDALKGVDGISCPPPGGSRGNLDYILLQHGGVTLAEAIARPLNANRPQLARLKMRLGIDPKALPKRAIGGLAVTASGVVLISEADITQGIKLVEYLVRQHELGKLGVSTRPGDASDVGRSRANRMASATGTRSSSKTLAASGESRSGVVRREIMNAMGRLGFEPNELAYLTLTSKPEGPVRDRVGWALMKAGLATDREWGGTRRDLAIWKGPDRTGDPAAVIEAKACHTFDLCANRPWLPSELAKDVTKSQSLSATVQVFLLVIVTHLEWGSGQAGIKYARRADPNEAANAAAKLLEAYGKTSRVPIGEGAHFGVHAKVDAWLCGPIGMPRRPE